jgi:hypothetical protein
VHPLIDHVRPLPPFVATSERLATVPGDARPGRLGGVRRVGWLALACVSDWGVTARADGVVAGRAEWASRVPERRRPPSRCARQVAPPDQLLDSLTALGVSRRRPGSRRARRSARRRSRVCRACRRASSPAAPAGTICPRVGGGDVVEHQRALARELALDALLSGKQPVHRLTPLVLGGVLHAQLRAERRKPKRAGVAGLEAGPSTCATISASASERARDGARSSSRPSSGRLHVVRGLSMREIANGLHRDTISRAIHSDESPAYRRAPAGSKRDRFTDEIHRLPLRTSLRLRPGRPARRSA